MRTHSWGTGRCDLTTRRLLELALCIGLSSCSSPRIEHGAGGGSGSTGHSVSAAGASSAPSDQSAAGEAATDPAPTFGWCDAQPIIADKCGRCHGEPLANGAPFSLATYADIQYVDARDRPRYERIQSAIESEYMPATFLKLEPAVEPLTESERRALLEWLAAGAPRGDAEACPDAP
jgi:hypothetical protein